jgi:CheY-like chemotaxis protein
MQGGTGVLSVEFSRVKIDEEPFDLYEIRTPVCLKLSVADTGDGMSPEIVARIFDPYFTTKEKGEGTGLGLAVVQGIVRASGGTIRVESKEGAGSRFHLYFPCIEMAAGETAEEGQLAMPGGTEKILIVDDEETLADMAGEMLQKLGYTVEVMTNSGAALKRYLSRPFYFDMVITDQTMPDLGGLELARKILAVRPSIPVILYTGYSASVTGREAKQSGIREFMMKPLSMTNLALTIRRVLNDG